MIEEEHLPEDIAEYLHVSVSTVRRVLRIYKKWGCVRHPLKGKGGRSKVFSSKKMEVCKEIVCHDKKMHVTNHINKVTTKVSC